MVNKVATDYWIYGEYADGFCKPENAFFAPRERDDLRSLQKAGEPEVLIWAKSDKPNNTLWKGLGFTPHQLVLGLSSGVPGIYARK